MQLSISIRSHCRLFICSVKKQWKNASFRINSALTVSTVAPQHIPILRNIKVCHGQGNVMIHSKSVALLAQVEKAA